MYAEIITGICFELDLGVILNLNAILDDDSQLQLNN